MSWYHVHWGGITKKKKLNIRKFSSQKMLEPSEASMMCTIDGTSFHSLTKNTWISDSGASCHITNDEKGMFDVTKINESIQGSSSTMSATKKGKLWVTVRQVNRLGQVNTLWPVKFCPSAGANLFSISCKLSWGNNISSDEANNIVVTTLIGNIVLDCQIKTHDGWVAGVDFLQNVIGEKAVSATVHMMQDINDLFAELEHSSEAITRSTAKNFNIQVTGAFKPCEDCALGKAKQRAVSKKAVSWSQILGERLFFDISFPSTLTFGGKCHWLLVIDDYSNTAGVSFYRRSLIWPQRW